MLAVWGETLPRNEDVADVKRVFHRVLCWSLVLAIAFLPTLAAAVAMGDGLVTHAMHGPHSSVRADASADHATGHDAAHQHRAHDDHAGRADPSHGSDAHESYSEPVQASDLAVHADCAAGDCVSTCSTCSHCQGMPAVSGMNTPTPELQARILQTLRSGPPAAALFRPPILS